MSRNGRRKASRSSTSGVQEDNVPAHEDADVKLEIIIGHCFFCLRRLTEPVPPQERSRGKRKCAGRKSEDELHRIVESVSLQPEKYLPTFNKVLPYFHQKWRRRGFTIKSFLETENVEQLGTEDGEDTPKDFPVLPAMCHSCGNKLIEVDTLIMELNSKLESIRKVILDSKRGGIYSWREEQFMEDLNKNPTVSSRSKTRTVEFMEGFGVDGDGSLVNAQDQISANFVNVDVDANSFSFINENDDEDSAPVVIAEQEVNLITGDVEDEDCIYYVDLDATESAQTEESNNEESQSSSSDNYSTSSYSPSNSPPRRRKVKRKRKLGSSGQPICRKSKYQRCDLCEIKVPFENILEHVRQHVGDYACPCPNYSTCKRVYSTPVRLERLHLRWTKECLQVAKPDCPCTPPKSKNCTTCHCTWEKNCEFCNFSSDHVLGLANHLSTAHEKDFPKDLECPLPGCSKTFAFRQTVQCHLALWHGRRTLDKLRVKGCSMCDMCNEFVPSEQIRDHLKGHVGDYVTNCPNPECNNVQSTPYIMEWHWRRNPKCRKYALPSCTCVPVKGKTGKNCLCPLEKICESCDFTTTDTLDLKKHIIRMHEFKAEEKPYPCPVSGCGEVFACRQAVQFHLNGNTHRVSRW